jgi:hypothetical protein
MTRPDLDVANVLRNLFDSEWTWTITKPGVIRLQTEDESGDPTKGVNAAVDEYILIAETGTRDPEWGGPRSVLDDTNQASFEFATVESRARREAVHNEIFEIAKATRDRREADLNGLDIGGWDTLDFSMTAPDEEIFNYWTIEGTVRFDATARTP